MPLYSEITACRACGSTDLAEALDLGQFAISDFKETADAFTDRAPLVLVRCIGCSLVQLRHTVDRDRLYRQYWYRSATQPAMVSALRDVVADARARVDLRSGDAVIDIGANDGTLLRMYPEGIRRVAYEPAENLWPLLQGSSWDNQREISSIYGYFPIVVGGKPVGMEPGAKIITSCACFYDVDDPNAFAEGIKASLAPDGVWINQLAYLPDTLASNNFGDIVHEHLTYWTIASFDALLRRHGLLIENWTHNDVNGGSIRFYVRHDTGQEHLAGEWIDPISLLDLKRFAQRIRLQRSEVRAWLHAAKRAGHTIIGYGASTKGNTYLQYWGIGPDLIEFIADRNPDKHGKFTPTGQRVISEADARAMRPAFFFVLPFHFIDAFVEREQDFLRDSGQFVVPFPELRTIGGDDVPGLQQGDPPPEPRAIQAA